MIDRCCQTAEPSNPPAGGSNYSVPSDDLSDAMADAADAADAVFEYDDARAWFAAARAASFAEPLAVEVWVFAESLSEVLLVEHRWRGWVPPGGAVEPGETPRAGAQRELLEETGLAVQLLPRPAAVCVRSYHPDWELTLGLSYAAIVPRSIEPVGEDGQPVAWKRLESDWPSMFPDDRVRMQRYLSWLADDG